jgi:hypothetical protein
MMPVNATRIVSELAEELPIGNSVTPVSESQIRPLLRLPEPEQRAKAWTTAADNAEGNQPTVGEVGEVVFEILHPEGEDGKTWRAAHWRFAWVATPKNALSRAALGSIRWGDNESAALNRAPNGSGGHGFTTKNRADPSEKTDADLKIYPLVFRKFPPEIPAKKIASCRCQ